MPRQIRPTHPPTHHSKATVRRGVKNEKIRPGTVIVREKPKGVGFLFLLALFEIGQVI